MTLIKRFLLPETIWMPFVAAGVLLWLWLPDEWLSLREKVYPTFLGILGLVLWYVLVILGSSAGRFVPIRFRSRGQERASFGLGFYLLVTAVSAIGFKAALGTIGSLQIVLLSITSQQVNNLKDAMYANYSPGMMTLRYMASVAGAIAIYHIIIKRRFSILDFLNIFFLLSIAFISARILLFQTVFYVTFLLCSRPGPRRKRPFLTAIGIVLMATVVVTFTYVRSAKTYRDQLGITNPLAVTGVEFGRYLAIPIQVSVGVSNAAFHTDMLDTITFEPMYLAPTFLQPARLKFDNSGGIGQQWYMKYVEVPRTLTTNSVLAESVGRLGAWSGVLIPAVCAIYSIAFYSMRDSNDIILRLYAAVTLYGFFEMWRTLYFSAGSFVFINILFTGYLLTALCAGKVRMLRIGARSPENAWSSAPGLA